jgi:hypothetical protein
MGGTIYFPPRESSVEKASENFFKRGFGGIKQKRMAFDKPLE